MVGGGAIRTCSVLEYLFTRYQVDVVCFRQPGAASTMPQILTSAQDTGLRRWVEIDLPHNGRSVWDRGIRNLERAWRGVPPLVDRFSGFDLQLGAALDGELYALGMVEHFWCSSYAPLLRAHCQRLYLDLHNAESLWQKRMQQAAPFWLRPIHQRFVSAAEALELQILPQFDGILATSQAEADFVANRLSGLPLTVVPNTLKPQPLPEAEKKPAIVFSGNMEYAPNQQAAIYFAREIWPMIRKRYPAYTWKVVGKSANLLRHPLGNISAVEFVNDPEDAMMEIAESRVAVVPLKAGAGTRLKILEAWAAGSPVVSTSLGAEGLCFTQGVDILIEDEPTAFANSVCKLIEDSQLANSLVNAGRRRFEQSYSWDSSWAALRASGI